MDDTPIPFGNRMGAELDLANGRAVTDSAALRDPGEASTGGGAQLTRMLSAVGRYKWLVVATTILGLAGAAVVRRFGTPVYRAEATIWIQVPDTRAAARGPISTGGLFETNGWIDLLRSFAVLDDVVLEHRLYVSASGIDRSALHSFSLAERFMPGIYQLTTDAAGKRYELRNAESILVESGTVGDSIGRKLGFQWAPALKANQEIQLTVTTPREAGMALNERLVHTVNNSTREQVSFIRLQFQNNDRTRVANILNSIADRFVAVGAELKRGQMSQLVEILESQRKYAEQNLRNAEIALEQFRIQTITLPSDEASPVTPGLESTRDPVMENYFQMKVEREQLRRDTEAVRSALQQTSESGNVADALASMPAGAQSAELTAALNDLTAKRAQLRALNQQYTTAHPVVQRLAQEISTIERQTIPRLGQAMLSQMNNRGSVIDGWISSASTDLQQIPPRMIEEARLRRDVEIAERLHTDLRARYEEARLATATSIPDIRVLDRATPPDRPLAGRGLELFPIGLIAGLAIGIGIAILLDRIDGRFRYPDQVTRQLGLPILGALPHVGQNGKNPNSTTQAIEALREIRLNIAHSVAGQQPLALAITSPGSGDGKTFISCNLALACASAGKRTLIIDGDTRRGQLHRMLNASRSPGLTDYLLEEVSLEQAVQHTEHIGLDFVGSGTRRETSPNLLGNSAMEELLRTAYRNYDVVLIDCPPLAAGVDPFLIGTLVRNVMLVLRTGRTDRALAEAKLQVLDRLPVQLIGAVLNGVEATGAYRYYSYLSGYEPPPDEKAEADKQLQNV